jgi:arsenate reductase
MCAGRGVQTGARQARKSSSLKELRVRGVMEERPFNVLFLCTGNSARSIMAEAILNRAGRGRFRAFSAGSQPKGQVHPYTIDLLNKLNYDVSKVRSKSWHELSSAQPMHQSSILSLRFATTPQPRPVRSGRGSR